MIVDLCTDTFSRQASQKMALFVPWCESLNTHLQIPGFLLLEKPVGSCSFRVYKPSIPIFARIIRRNVRLRARSDFSGAPYKDRALTTCLSCGSCPSSSSSSGFGSLDCLCPVSSQTRSEAPEDTTWPKKAYSSRITPQLYFLLLRPYCARNSAVRVCKGLQLR